MEGKDMQAPLESDEQSNSLMNEQEPDPNDTGEDSESDEGELERLEIETAANGGFVVTCYTAPAKTKDNESVAWSKPKKYAVTSRDELNAILDEKLGPSAPAAPAMPAAPMPGPGAMA